MSNTIDILLTKILQCGTLRFQPFIVTASGERILPCYETAHDDAHQTIRLCAEHNGLFRDCLYIEYADGEMTCRRTFENLSGNELKIREMGVELSGVTFGENPGTTISITMKILEFTGYDLSCGLLPYGGGRQRF